MINENKPIQNSFFDSDKQDLSENLSNSPLAFKLRPTSLENFIGQKHIFERYSFLKQSNFPSIIFWGPPGTGKTTLAHILAMQTGKEIYSFNAVLGGVSDLRKLIKSALEIKKMLNKESIIFIDEIHRFNKAQQDALLPYIEAGNFTLIGATTENPRRSINNALLSRVQIIEFKSLQSSQIEEILKKGLLSLDIDPSKEIISFIADHSGGDARKSLNNLEILTKLNKDELDLKSIKKLVLENSRNFDRNQDRHYDVISAFIKSMRGSDPDAALLWLAVMLDGGEDPVFIARRLVIFSSEDIGNADINALPLAVATFSAVQNIGMPEARINLAQAVTYLASTVKSNASYTAINSALEYVENSQNLNVPDKLKKFPPTSCKETYNYPHDHNEHFIKQTYTNEQLPKFYNPTEYGHEANLKKRLQKLWETNPND